MTSRAVFLVAMLFLTTACASNPKPQTVPGMPKEVKPPEPATISVYPGISAAGIKGATVRVEYRIERHPDNRSFYMNWADESGDWGGTGRSLDGENSEAAFNPIFLDRLYPGNYTVTLTLVRSENGKRREIRVRATFTIL